MKKTKIKILSFDSSISIISSLIAIILGLLIGLIALLVADAGNALNGFGAILAGGFSNPKNMGQVLYYATPIIMTGLSVGFAKKIELFNIGSPGQFIVGAYAAVYVGVKWSFLPSGIHCLAALLAAVAAGVVWGSIPGVLKAYFNTSEVISGIMLNYTGASLVNFLVRQTIFDSSKNQSYIPKASANLPRMNLDQIFVSGGTPSSVNAGIFIAIIACIIIYIILNKTRLGYELKACGFNKDAAKYAGINENFSVIKTMAIAGALSGLAGALLYLSGTGSGIPITDTLPPEGFSGISVALLGMCNPIAIIFSGAFIAYLTVGGLAMQTYGFVPQIIDIITAVIIYFSAFAFFFSGVIKKYLSKMKDRKKAGV